GAARGPVDEVPRAGCRGYHAGRVQPRDGRGGPVRPAGPDPGGPDHRRRQHPGGKGERPEPPSRKRPASPYQRPSPGGGGVSMSARILFSTAARILTQLRHDKRTIGLIIMVPLVLLTLVYYLFEKQPFIFDHIGLILLGLFPFVIMFLITSIAMLRE